MRYYYVQEICQLFGCSARSVHRWITDKKIKAEFEQGLGCIRRARIPESELDWIASHAKAGRPQGAKNKPKDTDTQKCTQN